MIRFNCPHCGLEITDEDKSVGKHGHCLGCGLSIRKPDSAEQEAAVFRATHVWDPQFVTSLTPISPSRRHWQMPWKWSGSTQAAVLTLTLAIYFLSAVPVTNVAVATDMVRFPLVNTVLTVVYSPVWWCQEHSGAAAAILGWEQDLIGLLTAWARFDETPPAPRA